MRLYFLVGLTVVLAAFAPHRALAQSFFVEASQPTAGQAGVPIEAVIRFELNEEVSFTTDFNTAVSVEPQGAISVSEVALLPDNDGVPSVVEYTVQHEPNTDYTWMVVGIEPSVGDAELTPYILRYSTAASIGNRSVSGTVAAGRPVRTAGHPPISPTAQDALQRLSRFFAETERGTVPFGPANTHVSEPGTSLESMPSDLPPAALFQRGGEDLTFVFLLDDYTANEEDWSVEAATVIAGGAGTYAVDFVGDGTYWPVAARFSGGFIDAFGFFDPNGDGAPDPVTVAGSDITAVGLSLFSFEATTAQTYVADANAAANAVSDAPVLKLISADYGIDPNGTAFTWIYRYISGDGTATVTVAADPLTTVAEVGTLSTLLLNAQPVPGGFVDSDVALDIALANGGSAFLAEYDEDEVTTSLTGGNQYWTVDPPRNDAFWRVRFVGVTAGGSASFVALVDMVGGVILAGEESTPRGEARLGANYPNPFASATTIPVSLDRAGPVTLSVYDVLGRRVATPLANTALPAGDHTIRWDAEGITGGVYIVRLETDGSTDRRVVLLQR